VPAPAFLSGADVPDYLIGVELLTAGMEWPASTGPVTITMEHLADAVRASNDPHIQVPRIKLGHTSSINGDHEDHNPFAALGDAEPSFGQFVNLRLENDGAVLVADATNIPAWLAQIAPAAYPNRSSEATWNVDSPSVDVQTNGGRRYSCVVTAVSLLGVVIPAIGDLEDLTPLLMAGPSAASTSASVSDTDLSVSHSTVRDRFNWEWAVEREGNDFDGDTTWWWARDVRVDDDEIIADDDEGHLWAVPFTTDGEDTITFGDPARVRQTFVPVAAAQIASFSRPDKQAERPAVIAAAKPSRKPAAAAATDPAATRRSDPEGDAMTEDVKDILTGLGLDPDTATEQQVQIATNAAAYAIATAPKPTADAPEVPQADADAEGSADADADADVEAPERVPVAAKVEPDPIQAAKDAAMADMSARLEAMTQRENARLTAEMKTRRDAKATAAVGDKITPAEREHYRALYDIDEERTDALLSSLPSGRVPMEARAEAPDPDADQFTTDDGFLPENVSLLTHGQRGELRARRGA